MAFQSCKYSLQNSITTGRSNFKIFPALRNLVSQHTNTSSSTLTAGNYTVADSCLGSYPPGTSYWFPSFPCPLRHQGCGTNHNTPCSIRHQGCGNQLITL